MCRTESNNQVINQEKQNLSDKLQSCKTQLTKLEDGKKAEEEAKKEALQTLAEAKSKHQTLTNQLTSINEEKLKLNDRCKRYVIFLPCQVPSFGGIFKTQFGEIFHKISGLEKLLVVLS